MSLHLTDKLPLNARVWVYQSDRPLTGEEAAYTQNELQSFVDRWTSHKVGVSGAGYVLFNRFIVLMADEQAVSVGGCSIDSSVHFIKSLQNQLQTDFFNRLLLAYRLNNAIETAPIQEFISSVKAGSLPEDTIIFNNTVLTKQELLNSWQIPFNQSSLKNVQPASAPFAPLL